VKNLLLLTLERLRLLGPVYRVYERALALGPDRASAVPDDGLPLPPRDLIVRVTGSADPDWFVESGRLAAGSIRTALMRHGLNVEQFDSLLDFGCGCGRVIRNWRALPSTKVHGSDYSAKAIAWSRANLPFARFETNGLAPPLAYEDRSFDFIYALSVFTHLPEPLQDAWMRELSRVLRAGGYLVITTHGESYRGKLTAAERERFDRGEPVVRWRQLAGSNLCAAYHPRSYVERLAGGFEVVDFAPEGAKGNPQQDQYLLRRR
jgi:SAM-dependent methyltransferase